MASRVTDSATRALRVGELSSGSQRTFWFKQSRTSVFKLLPAAVLVIVLLLIPLGNIFVMSFDSPNGPLGNYIAFFESTGYRSSLLVTFEISLSVTALCILLGFPYAWSMVYAPKALGGILLALLMVPLWTSLLVRTYAWLIVLNPGGVINSILMSLGLTAEPLELVHNRFGVLVGMTQIMLPFFVLPLYAVMRGFDQRLVRAAKSLGANPFRAFFTVFVPGVAPGIVAGSVLVFIISIGFFITPALLGGGQDTMLSQLIEQQFSTTLNWGLGSTMASILVLATVLALLIAALLTKPQRRKLKI